MVTQKINQKVLETDHPPPNSPSNVITCASSVCAFSLEENWGELECRWSSTRKLTRLILFYLLAMAVEIAGGLKSNSLAVLTDAAHLFSDGAGFGISLFAVWASGWRPTSNHSFGFHRLEVLGALFSVQLIWVVTGFLMFKATDRVLHQTEPVNGRVMFFVALFGFAINLVMVTWMGHHHHHHHHSHGHGHHHEDDAIKLVSDVADNVECQKEDVRMNINLQGAYLHVVSDLIQSVGVMIAGAVIWVKPKWVFVDLICTAGFSVAVLISTRSMLVNVFGILMERSPRDIDIGSLENGLKTIKGVSEVHDLHVWCITVGKTAMSCNVKVKPGFGSKGVLHDIRQFCQTSFKIHHLTVQIEQE